MNPSAPVSALALAAALLALNGEARGAEPLDPLYDRIAADLKRGRPLVVTVHVALCDNRVIHCGGRRLGDGDRPGRNLYWGAAGGFRAYFDRQRRSYRRVLLDGGDRKVILARAAYLRRIRRPGPTWRRRGVTRPFEVLVIGLAYRGMRIGSAMDALVHQVAAEGGVASTLTIAGRQLPIGASGHLVGYAGHNHLMDVVSYRFPRVSRRTPLGFFALACYTSQYLADHLQGPALHALLLTRTRMYPGAFTLDGLVRGVSAGASAREVFRRGAAYYARVQRRPARLIRRAFTFGPRSARRRQD